MVEPPHSSVGATPHLYICKPHTIRSLVQDAAEDAACQQRLLMDHVDSLSTKRVQVQDIAAQVKRLGAEVSAMHAAMRLRVQSLPPEPGAPS